MTSRNAAAIEQHLLELQCNGARAPLIGKRRQSLRHLANWAGKSLLDLQDDELCRWRDELLARGSAAATAEVTYVRVFYRWAVGAAFVITPPAAFLARSRPSARYDVAATWAEAIEDWRQSLVTAGRTPRTIRLWLNYINRAASAMPLGPAQVSPTILLGGLRDAGLAQASMVNARTAVRRFYVHLGSSREDPLMVVALPRMPTGEWAPAIDAWATFERVRGYSSQTIALHRHHLRRASEQLTAGPWDATLDDLLRLLDVATWSAETRRAWRGSLRSFYRWAVDTGRLAEDPTRMLPAARVAPGKPRPVPDVVVDAALRRAEGPDQLMLALAAYAGLRRGEIARVHSSDVVQGVLRVVGKGDRTRLIPLHPLLEAALAHVEGYAFPGRTRDHVTADVVGRRLSRLLGPGWTAHTLRHRFASKAYAVDRDLFAVQSLLGHTKPETTARYTAIPDGALRAAVLGADAGLLCLTS